MLSTPHIRRTAGVAQSAERKNSRSDLNPTYSGNEKRLMWDAEVLDDRRSSQVVLAAGTSQRRSHSVTSHDADSLTRRTVRRTASDSAPACTRYCAAV